MTARDPGARREPRADGRHRHVPRHPHRCGAVRRGPVTRGGRNGAATRRRHAGDAGRTYHVALTVGGS